MKLYYLSRSKIPSREANSVQVMKMCAAFARVGATTTLFAWDGKSKNDPYQHYGTDNSFKLELISPVNVPVIRKLWYLFALILKFRLRGRPDAVFGRDSHSLLICSFFGCPIIFEAHELPQRFVDRLVESLLLRRKNLRAIVTITQALADDYQASFPFLSAKKILVAPDGADLPNPPNNRPTAISEIQSGKTSIGYVGHLYPGKGMEIIAELAPLMEDVEFHVVGGTNADIRYWEAQVSCDNLHFHGYVSPGELDDYYWLFDIMLAPTQESVLVNSGRIDIGRWTSPLKIFEYMAHQKPIVASDTAALREVLEDGRNALLVPPSDVESWARAITSIRQDKTLGEKIARAARQDWGNKYSWNRRAKNILNRFPPLTLP